MVKQKLIAKYGKKFAATEKDAAPVLKGVHYAADGTAFVTNRHFGLRIKRAHSFPQDITLDVKSGVPIMGEYPSFDRVFPRDFVDLISLSTGDVLDGAIGATRAALAVASEINSKALLVKMIADQGTVRLNVDSVGLGITFLANFGNMDSIKHSNRTLNASYLLTALQVFKDADRDVRIWLNNPMQPILLTDGEDIDVILLPYRVVD